MRDWQPLIFKLGELEALGRSEPLGLAVRFRGCEVSCGGGEGGGVKRSPHSTSAQGMEVFWGCTCIWRWPEPAGLFSVGGGGL